VPETEVITPTQELDRLLDEIEALARVEKERHMVVVVLESGDDESALEAKRVRAIERLGVHPMSVDLTVVVDQRTCAEIATATNEDERIRRR